MMLRFALLLSALVALSTACSDDAEPPGTAGVGGGSGSGGKGGSGGSGGSIASSCTVAFSFKPEAGTTVSSVAVAGEWNAFDAQANLLIGPDADGAFTGTMDIAPGNWAYKLVLDGTNWVLDPGQGYRKFVDGEENSALRVKDCGKPSLSVQISNIGANSYDAKLMFQAAKSGAAVESATATLRHAGTETPLNAITVDAGSVNLNATGLTPGKYTASVVATDSAGIASDPLRLVFWIEAERFEWQDALVYMIVTDRYRDGDTSNDPGPTSGVQDPRGDWKGGDLEGVRQKIADGTLDQLGIRAIWLTPFQTNPEGSYLASDGFHLVTGYHGYWPTKAREVDARIGGEAALHAMVKEAHAHGIRVLMDYVVNHIHEGHEYFTQHPSWFRTGCVCGTDGCDWTAQRLECLFTPYLPDVNWTVPEVSDQFEADAVWWLDTFDLDGLRVDAVKHVEDASIRNISTRVSEEFEAAGTRYFLMGETAMGWSDCGVECNQEQYGTISNYIGPFALDGQFDFVLYHGVPYRVFAYDTQGMLHADFWAQQSLVEYPKDAIMTPFIGSHDSSRFVTLATYRGQPGFDQSIPSHQWDDLAVAPPDAEPYERHALALSWLLGLPGAPLLYYGDEYGEWGGADPGNRAMWRGDATLSVNENAVLTRTRLLGSARQELRALRRGSYRSLHASETFLAFSRETETGETAIVALSRDPDPTTTEVVLPATFPLANGSVLKDRLGGPDATITAGKLSIQLAGRSAAILAP